MQYKDIEIFLELVNTRNITKASDNLFLAQSVISTRLKRLEEELGYDLFIRSKGQREIELTREGKEFSSLALKLQGLYEEASQIGEDRQQILRLAAPESVFLTLIEPITLSIMHKYPELKINAEMVDSSGVYELMDANLIDFGFSTFETSHHNINHRHLYDQEFTLVMAERRHGPVDARELDPAKEIIFTGGNFASVELWRSTHFSGGDQSRIRVNSAVMIAKCLKEFEGSWAVMPKGTADVLAQYYGTYVCEMSDAPEKRKIFFLFHAGGSSSYTRAAEVFLEELKAYEKY